MSAISSVFPADTQFLSGDTGIGKSSLDWGFLWQELDAAVYQPGRWEQLSNHRCARTWQTCFTVRRKLCSHLSGHTSCEAHAMSKHTDSCYHSASGWYGVVAPLFQREKKTTPKVFVRCPCYSDSTQQKVWVTASYDGHRGLKEAQERWNDIENSGSVHEPTKAHDPGPPPGAAFLTGLMSPLTGVTWLQPRWPTGHPLSVVGTGTPTAGLCPHSSVFLQTLAQTIPSPPSSLDSPWSPEGFHLTHHLTCSLPLPWPPHFQSPFAFVQNMYYLPTQTHWLVMFTVYRLSPPARIQLHRELFYWYARLDIARPCSVSFAER